MLHESSDIGVILTYFVTVYSKMCSSENILHYSHVLNLKGH